PSCAIYGKFPPRPPKCKPGKRWNRFHCPWVSFGSRLHPYFPSLCPPSTKEICSVAASGMYFAVCAVFRNVKPLRIVRWREHAHIRRFSSRLRQPVVIVCQNIRTFPAPLFSVRRKRKKHDSEKGKDSNSI